MKINKITQVLTATAIAVTTLAAYAISTVTAKDNDAVSLEITRQSPVSPFSELRLSCSGTNCDLKQLLGGQTVEETTLPRSQINDLIAGLSDELGHAENPKTALKIPGQHDRPVLSVGLKWQGREYSKADIGGNASLSAAVFERETALQMMFE